MPPECGLLRIDNHFPVMLGLRRAPVRRTTIPVAPALILGRGYWTRFFRAGAPSIRHVVASRYPCGRVHRAARWKRVIIVLLH